MLHTMKKLLLLLSFIVAVGCTQAQNNAKIQNIPKYKILTPDSTYRTQANLKKAMPVMIIYFMPDCGHCQQLIYDMKERMKQDFSKVQIVLITDAMYKMVKGFHRDFGLSAYPNVTVGTEQGSYDILNYYGVKMTPYVAIYNRNGKLLKTFDKEPKVKDLAAVVKKG